MADFTIKDPHEFSQQLRKFEPTDRAHADVFNEVMEVLINNDAFLYAPPFAEAQTRENIQSGDTIDVILGKVQKMFSCFLDLTHPVGSIYESTNPTDPGQLFGGTWELFGQGKMLMGVDAGDIDFEEAEKTGGAKTVNLSHEHTVDSHNHTVGAHAHGLNAHVHSTANHVLTAAEMPKHRHTIGPGKTGNVGSGSGYTVPIYNSEGGTGGTTTDTGSSVGHNHGNTGAASGNTANSASFNSGSAAPGTNSKLSAAQSILPPYVTCYRWKRTA